MILHGDALTMLKTLPDESVHCCVTSPPYWGLRDYGTAKWEGGSITCDHISRPQVSDKAASNRGSLRDNPYKNICLKCGAIRVDGQLGLEKTPEEYTEKMTAVFREVRRVLRTDGTLWLNLGDSYNGSGKGPGGTSSKLGNVLQSQEMNCLSNAPGLKPKDLVGIPWRVAFALQADGWYLRSDIIWHKPNPMPESVTDRCTKAHEYIFLMSKNGRYYYDGEAVKEPAAWDRWGNQTTVKDHPANSLAARFGNKTISELPIKDTRNRRSVWTVATKPFSEAHFATFPPDLIKPCILAGCPKGGIVLDPFFGSGTTGLVCSRLNREYVGIELNAGYVEMAKRRIEGDAPLLNLAIEGCRYD